jgi:DMSO reductase anchor subunit
MRTATTRRAPERPVSYYGRPVLKQPVWTWEIPLYFVAGGVSGASAGLAFAARAAGNVRLAERAQFAAFGTIAISPLLLISDLGRPGRFLNMLRVFKPSSPMSVGSWLLAANSAGTGLATLGMLSGKAPRLTRVAGAAAGVLGMPLTTYTAVLISNTAVPLWHEARHELPFVFGGSSAAGAGALVTLLTPHEDAGPARRLATIGTVIEGASSQLMERRLGDLAEPMRTGQAGRLARTAQILATTGAVLTGALGNRRPWAARVGAAMVLAGEITERWSVFRAGFQSAADPGYTVAPQGARRARESGS